MEGNIRLKLESGGEDQEKIKREKMRKRERQGKREAN